MKFKNVITFFGGLTLFSFILLSCTENANDKKEVSPVVEKSKTSAVSSEEKTVQETSQNNSPNELPIVKAESEGDKYFDWGSKPTETEDGPADPWTMPFMMCQGPPFMDGQLKASSTLASQGKKQYSVSNISDDDPTTAWVEGKPDYGVGEYLEMKWVPMGDGEISLLNGYQSSKDVWKNNSRVKNLKVSVGGKEVCEIELKDVMGIQKFKIPGLVKTTKKGHEYNVDGPIRFTIMKVYPGLKYKDTAISGIFSCGG